MPSLDRCLHFFLFVLFITGLAANDLSAGQVPAGQKKPGQRDKVIQEELERLWADMASLDSATAHRAFLGMSKMPEQAIPFLKERLRPAPKPDPKQIRQLVAQFTGNDFTAQEKAAKELKRLDLATYDPMAEALANDPPEPVRKRLQELLQILDNGHRRGGNPEVSRDLWAVGVLRAIGSAEAQRILEALAGGDLSSHVTLEAESALMQLNRQWKPPPPKDLERLWAEMASLNAMVAHTARRKLADVPEKAIPLLKERVRSAPKPDPERIQQLLAQFLGDDSKASRAAEEELKRLDGAAEEAASDAWRSTPQEDVRRRERLGRLMNGLQRPGHLEVRRGIGAVVALELIGSKEAQQRMVVMAVRPDLALGHQRWSQEVQQFLEVLAGGDRSARLTFTAEQALKRLNPRWEPLKQEKVAARPKAAPLRAPPKENQEHGEEPHRLEGHRNQVTVVVWLFRFFGG